MAPKRKMHETMLNVILTITCEMLFLNIAYETYSKQISWNYKDPP